MSELLNEVGLLKKCVENKEIAFKLQSALEFHADQNDRKPRLAMPKFDRNSEM